MNGRTEPRIVTDESRRDEGLVPLVKRMADSVEHLVEDHLKLARLELAEDAKRMVKQGIGIGALVPVMISGLVLVFLGVAVLIGNYLGLWIGLLIVGGVALLGGALAAAVIVRRMRAGASHAMDATRAEATQTRGAIENIRHSRPQLEAHHGR